MMSITVNRMVPSAMLSQEPDHPVQNWKTTAHIKCPRALLVGSRLLNVSDLVSKTFKSPMTHQILLSASSVTVDASERRIVSSQ